MQIKIYEKTIEKGMNLVDYLTGLAVHSLSRTSDRIRCLENSVYAENRPSELSYTMRDMQRRAIEGLSRVRNKLFSLTWETL